MPLVIVTAHNGCFLTGSTSILAFSVNMWGFKRLLSGGSKGGYNHVNFVRGKPSLCRFMIRLKVKGTGIKKPYGDSAAMPLLARSPTTGSSSARSPLAAMDDPKPVFMNSGNSNVNVTWTGPTSSRTTTTNLPMINSRSFSQNSAAGCGATNFATTTTNTTDIDLFDDEALSSVLSSVFQDPSHVDVQPVEGDALLFEGMQFFFVEDTSSGTTSSDRTGGERPRRMSIQLNQQGPGGRRRRLSLISSSGGSNADALSPEKQVPPVLYTAGGNAAAPPPCPSTISSNLMTPFQHARRRFSLERNISSAGRNDFILKYLKNDFGFFELPTQSDIYG